MTIMIILIEVLGYTYFPYDDGDGNDRGNNGRHWILMNESVCPCWIKFHAHLFYVLSFWYIVLQCVIREVTIGHQLVGHDSFQQSIQYNNLLVYTTMFATVSNSNFFCNLNFF